MATIICMDGLGGHPDTTFGSLRNVLESDGHKVVIIDTSSVVSHEDRVKLILEAYNNLGGNRDLFLLGQSAGGSAVRITAEKLENMGKLLGGVILLSPAMPFGVWFVTLSLMKVMLANLREFLFGQTVTITEIEHLTLVEPIAIKASPELITKRQPISCIEGRELAFYPPKFVGYKFPTLHIFGEKDAWISPRAQRVFSKMLRRSSTTVSSEILGAGHLTLASEKSGDVVRTIQEWIVAMSSST